MCKAKLALVWLGRSLPACHRADCHEMTCVRDAHIANTRQSPPPPPKQPDSRAQRRPKIVDNVWALSCLCQHSACACAARRRFSAPHRRRRSSFAARCAWRGRIAVRVLSRGAVWSAVRRCCIWLGRRLPVSGRVRRAPLERAATLALSSPRAHPERCLGTALRRLRGRRRRGERETEGSGASSGFWPRGPAA